MGNKSLAEYQKMWEMSHEDRNKLSDEDYRLSYVHGRVNSSPTHVGANIPGYKRSFIGFLHHKFGENDGRAQAVLGSFLSRGMKPPSGLDNLVQRLEKFVNG